MSTVAEVRVLPELMPWLLHSVTRNEPAWNTTA